MDGRTVEMPQAGLDPLLAWHPEFAVHHLGKPDRYLIQISLRSDYAIGIQADEDDLLDLADRVRQAIGESHRVFATSSTPAAAPCEQCQTTRTGPDSR